MDTQIGTIDEKGFINSLDRDGISFIRGIFELIGNSIDGKCKNFTIIIEDEKIMFIDDGKGMTSDDLKNAFSFYKSNHSDDESIGVSGYGLKAALKKLSNNKIATVYTHSKDSNYIKAIVNWDKIIKDEKYTGNIVDKAMEQKEIDLFNKYNSKCIGTMIEIPFQTELYDTIIIQFKKNVNGDFLRYELEPSCRIDFIFGNFQNELNIQCKDKTKQKEYTVDFYNPHGLDKIQYLGPETLSQKIHTIRMFKNIDGEYIFATPINDTIYHFFKNDTANTCNGIDNIYTDKIPYGFNHISDFKQKISFIKPKISYFNTDKPVLPTQTGLTSINEYDDNFYGKSKQTSYKNNKMLYTRNNSRIGNIKIGPMCQTGGQNTYNNKFIKLHTSTELYSNTKSTQINEVDEYMQIQKNKHQYSPDINKMKPLIRLCEFNRKEFSTQLWKWIINKVDTYNHVNSSASASASATDNDNDNDSNSDSDNDSDSDSDSDNDNESLTHSEPEQVDSEQEQVDSEPEQVDPEPEPEQVDPEPEQVDPEPEQVDPESEQVDPEPEQVDSEPEPEQVDSEPEQVDPEPEQVDPEPEQVDPEPESNLIKCCKTKKDGLYFIKSIINTYTIENINDIIENMDDINNIEIPKLTEMIRTFLMVLGD